jgi:hypothetical protein
MKAFLDYLQGKGTKSDFTRRIDDEVNKARTHEEWKVEYMSLFLRDQEMREEGEEKGREETRRTTVLNMLKENDPIDKICRVAECDEAYVDGVKFFL